MHSYQVVYLKMESEQNKTSFEITLDILNVKLQVRKLADYVTVKHTVIYYDLLHWSKIYSCVCVANHKS